MVQPLFFVKPTAPKATATCAQPHAYSAFSGNTNNNPTAASTTYYFAADGATSLQTADSAGITRTPIPRAGTIQNLYIVTDVPNSSAKTNPYTLIQNCVSQPLTSPL